MSNIFLKVYLKTKVFLVICQRRNSQIYYLKIFQKKPIIPSVKELKENIPSRSAKLRYVIKKKDFYEFETDIFEKFKYLLEIEDLGNRL